MELVTLAKEVFQNAAEQAASYRIGQTALRHLDRMLWVIEKCARWAVPPPLDQDERPQPELVRPLPWVFFLALLVALRIARESISLLNLVMGKPPLRSADVVMYIQSKRRYLRTLKYQGNRLMRARTSSMPARESWADALHSLFEFTMCFRRHSPHYGNNNTTSLSNNDEVLVVKRSKRREARPARSGSAGAGETTMERLIEKMMVDLDADSDEDSSFTLTNVTSPKSDRSDFTVDSDQDTVFHNNISNIPNENETSSSEKYSSNAETVTEGEYTNINEVPSSTPEKNNHQTAETYNSPAEENSKIESETANEVTPSKNEAQLPNNETPLSNNETPLSKNETPLSKNETPLTKNDATVSKNDAAVSKNDAAVSKNEDTPSKIPRSPNNEQKIANGRTVKSVPSKKKGTTILEKERRNTDKHVGVTTSGNNTM